MLNRNRFLTLLALLFMVLGSYSQIKSEENLQQQLNNHLHNDTIKVNLLIAFAEKIYLKNPAKALQLLSESEKLANTLNYNKGKMDCYLQLGKLFNASENYEKTNQYATQGAILANKANNKKYKKAFFLLLSEFYYDKNKSVNDSTIREEVRDITAEIKYKYFLKDSLDKTAERENLLKEKVVIKENELLLAQFEKYIWILGCIALVILFAFVMSLVNIRKIKLQNKQLLTEQKLRRSQMNPHFIFNSIQNVRSLISDDKPREAIEYLNTFSILTRQILESSNENYISLSDELLLIENYITLQQLLYNNPFQFTLKTNDIDVDSFFIPPMLTQPFIENAIKHGLSDKKSNGLITIQFYKKANKLFFEITDNGIGFNEKKHMNHKSLSVKLTKERLSTYFKNNHFEFISQNRLDNEGQIIGVKILFEIPYIYEN